MLINWFTVFAQIINFLILVYLLKRFLYGPIVRAMDERERKIADTLNRARDAEKEARLRANEATKLKVSLIKARDRLLSDAKTEVAEWRNKAIKEIRQEISLLRERWVTSINQQKESFINGLRKMVLSKVMQIGEKVLNDLAQEDMDRRILSVFLKKLSNEKNTLNSSKTRQLMLINTGFPLDEKTADDCRKKILAMFPFIGSVNFDVSDELGMGVKALVEDSKVEWNLTDYLKGLEQEILKDLSKLSGEKN